MQLKSRAAIIVLLLVVASLSVAGCTIEPKVEVGPTNQATDVSPVYPTTGRSQLVEACVYNDKVHAESPRIGGDKVKVTFNVTWESDTKATTTEKTFQGDASRTDNTTHTYTYIHFPTVEAASSYFDSQSLKYEYRPATISSSPLDYKELTGHNQTVYKQREDRHVPSSATAKITQYDALIVESYSDWVTQYPGNQA